MATCQASAESEQAESNRNTLVKRLRVVRDQTLKLAAPLSAEDCAIQSMPDASPVKWHLAHTTWFFETFLLAAFEEDFRPFDPGFRALFNSYYNAVGDRHPRPERGMITRPDLPRVIAYRQDVDERLERLLEKRGEPGSRIAELAELGLQHEQQHQELILTDVKHLLSRNPLLPAYRKNRPLSPVETRSPEWLPYAGGLILIGDDGEGFAFDNERPRHRVFLEPFELATRPVCNGDFAAFIADGGYQRPELWLSLGWDIVRERGWEAPMYWQSIAGRWHAFTLHGLAPVDHDAPVCHVSFFEAEAFARWSGARLPTEAEWELAASDCDIEGNFLESQSLHPLALREVPEPGKPAQLFGEVWEWTRSDYAPYPGYRSAEGAVGEYNGKFMCSQYVLRGGSCATPRSHIRASYRNFFPPDARWQFSGLRLARDYSA